MKTLTRKYLELKDEMLKTTDKEELSRLAALAEHIKKERINQMINKTK